MVNREENHIGDVFDLFEVIDVIRDENNIPSYKCRCKECGWTWLKNIAHAKEAKECRHKQSSGDYKNFSTRWRNKRIGHIFSGMKTRCYDVNDKNYMTYGGKGIRVCQEWLDNPELFEEWSLDNGYEDNLTIDRIDSTKDYCPDNCRWVTLEDNAKYKSTTRVLDVDGELHTGRDWAVKLGLGVNMINNYVRRYGEDNTKQFIKRVLKNPDKVNSRQGKQTLYNLYMN